MSLYISVNSSQEQRHPPGTSDRNMDTSILSAKGSAERPQGTRKRVGRTNQAVRKSEDAKKGQRCPTQVKWARPAR